MNYETHPAANEFPMLDAGRHAELVEDIRAHGQREAIKLLDGKILDGRNRAKACAELGITPKTVTLPPGTDPWAYVWSLNGARRDLEANTRFLIWHHCNAQSEAWQAKQAADTAAANEKRSEAAKAGDVGRASAKKKKSGLVVDQVDQPLKKKEAKTRTAMAKASKTNAGAVARGMKLKKARPDLEEKVRKGEIKFAAAERQMKKDKLAEKTRVEVTKHYKPIIACADAMEWLRDQKNADALITDPPYSTDVPDIRAFAAAWLPLALSKVKPTGRAYVCIGAYPEEIAAYLSVAMPTQILVWTYRNTLGPSPAHTYKLNWQAILYYQMPDAPRLNCPVMNEQFSVQDINAPDGRLGDRFHAWQKPMQLAERLVRHSTNEGGTVIDPFCCTGTFLLAAAKLGRRAYGCDIDRDHLKIAEGLGAVYE